MIPTISSFYFSFTRWDLFTSTWIGLKNYRTFFAEQALVIGLRNTLDLRRDDLRPQGRPGHGAGRAAHLEDHRPRLPPLGHLLPRAGQHHRCRPHLHRVDEPRARPDQQRARRRSASTGPGWLTNPNLAIFSIALVDVWKGVGLATVIFIAGLVSIPQRLLRGRRGRRRQPRDSLPAHHAAARATRPPPSVITLSLIGGLRSFDLIWAMTEGGPGFASDVIASVIYKQYQAGFYGLSTAGSVVLFLVVTVIVVPLTWWLNRGEVADEKHPRRRHRRASPSS